MMESSGSSTIPSSGRWRESATGLRRWGAPGPSEGYTLIEILVVLLLAVVLLAATIPRGRALLQEERLRGAAYAVRSLLRQVRARAAAEARYIGVVFEEVDGDPVFALYGDGNGNGIRRVDIARGTDEKLREPYRLSETFPGVRYGSLPTGASEPFFPGLRIGRSKIVSFSPLGSCTTGTLFLSNDYGLVYAVVVLGTTGRVRIARFIGGKWQAI